MPRRSVTDISVVRDLQACESESGCTVASEHLRRGSGAEWQSVREEHSLLQNVLAYSVLKVAAGSEKEGDFRIGN